MDDTGGQTMEQVRRFVEGNDGVEFKRLCGPDAYEWVESTLRRFGYERLKRPEKGVMRKFISRVTGYSRAQVSRLIGKYGRKGQLRRRQYRRHRFAAKYSSWDMALLARTDDYPGIAANGLNRLTSLRSTQQAHKAKSHLSKKWDRSRLLAGKAAIRLR